MYDRNFIVHIKIKFSEIFNIIRQYKLLKKKLEEFSLTIRERGHIQCFPFAKD